MDSDTAAERVFRQSALFHQMRSMSFGAACSCHRMEPRRFSVNMSLTLQIVSKSRRQSCPAGSIRTGCCPSTLHLRADSGTQASRMRFPPLPGSEDRHPYRQTGIIRIACIPKNLISCRSIQTDGLLQNAETRLYSCFQGWFIRDTGPLCWQDCPLSPPGCPLPRSGRPDCLRPAPYPECNPRCGSRPGHARSPQPWRQG